MSAAAQKSIAAGTTKIAKSERCCSTVGWPSRGGHRASDHTAQTANSDEHAAEQPGRVADDDRSQARREERRGDGRDHRERQADRRGEHEAGVRHLDEHGRRAERMQPEEARRDEERHRDEEQTVRLRAGAPRARP